MSAVKRRTDYRPLFPYFGGKAPVARVVWEALGAVENYVEPFFGSGAVLFLRPGGARGVETVNDAEGLVANFWRAVQADPDAVAVHADNPVNEADLHARHLWLVGQRERLTERLMGDPGFFDAKAAGWWVWGLSCWIGSGWCSGTGPWIVEDGEIVLRNSGQGVNRQLPHLGNSGQGVNRQLPHLGDPGRERLAWLTEEIGRFSRRLRGVRVCCGDWTRVCGPAVTYRHGLTGVFLDPPYGEGRTPGLYSTDTLDASTAVRDWAVEQGDNPLMRIVLTGYEGDYEMPGTWTPFEWQATGGYGLIGDDEDAGGRANRRRERLWFSPHCVRERSLDMFAVLGEAAS